MLDGKDLTEYVVARLLDFVRPGERWFRGLWDIGTVLSLRELIEASEAAANSVLSEASVRWLSADTLKASKADYGVPLDAREELHACLAEPPRFEEAHWYSLKDLSAEINDGYLPRWASAVVAAEQPKGKPIKPERMARLVASHLLDGGVSPQFLGAWLLQRLRDAKTWSLPDLLMDLDRIVRLPPIPYSVLIFVSSGIRLPDVPEEWISADVAKRLLLDARIPKVPFRYGGAWLLNVEQKDAYSAAADAFDDVDRRSARLRVGRGQVMSALSRAYVFGEPRPVRVDRADIAHRIRIRSIERQKMLFGFQPSNPIDAAFELLAQVDGSAAIAAAAGWAAMEALLGGRAEDKVVAADRMGSLVAASFPRAELTSLAARVIHKQGALAPSLSSILTNRERAQAIADELSSGGDLGLTDWSDRAAVSRMKGLLAEPRTQLEDVALHVARSMRRYYRQRNLVLHWGKTSPVALRAALRTGTPLLAAGVDRIAHAWFVNKIAPQDLAKRVRSKLNLAQRPGRKITELLEGFA